MASSTSNGQSWDDRYAEEGFAFGDQPNDFLVESAATFGTGTSLVVGDGDGRNGVWLAQQGHHVTSIDLSPIGVAKAKKLAEQRGTTLDARVGDLETFDMGDAKWESIVSIFCHVPSTLRHIVHANVKRALKPGGVFVLEAYTKANIGRGVGGPQNDDLTVEIAELEADFAGWDLITHRAVERNIVEGKYHDGLSSTVQFLARKPRS
jgi:SAM-dependent methyltransferase